MIHVIATIELAEGTRDAFLAEFRRIIPTVRQEAGCIEYGPAVDLPTDIPVQDPVRPNVALVIEKWESVAALQAHVAAPHMAEYRKRVANMVKRISLQILQPAS